MLLSLAVTSENSDSKALRVAIDDLPPELQAPWYTTARAQLFGTVFAIVFALGCVWTALQDTQWRSTALVMLNSPPILNEAEVIARPDDIQSRTLLAPAILVPLSEYLARNHAIALAPGDLGRLLKITIVSDTEFVEIMAEGTDPEVLPLAVNGWIDIYQSLHAQEPLVEAPVVEQDTNNELGALNIRLRDARQELEVFRRANSISGANEEQQALASQFSKLSDELARAEQDRARALTHWEALKTAVSKGENIIPPRELQRIKRVESSLAKEEDKLARLDAQYTRAYIERNPRMSKTLSRVRELEVEVEQAYLAGQEIELTRAQQDYAAASESVVVVEQQIAANREAASGLTGLGATEKELAASVRTIEQELRAAEARYDIEPTPEPEMLPALSILQRAPAESVRAGPDYAMLLGLSVGFAFLAGVIAVWLRGFLTS